MVESQPREVTERLLAPHRRGERGYSGTDGPSRTQWKTTFFLGGAVVCAVVALCVASGSLLQYVKSPSKLPQNRITVTVVRVLLALQEKNNTFAAKNNQGKEQEHNEEQNSAPRKSSAGKPLVTVMNKKPNGVSSIAAACKSVHLALEPSVRTKLSGDGVKQVSFRDGPSRVQSMVNKPFGTEFRGSRWVPA